MSAASRSRKRSRAEQRDAARAAIVDAAIACLLEDGHASTSTRRVGERAGMSQGAVQHYFPTRADLLDAAIRSMADQTARDVIQAFSGIAGNDREKVLLLLDASWRIAHTGPLTAALDILAASRTDLELAALVAGLSEHVDAAIRLATVAVLGDVATRAGAHEWVRTALMTIAGATLMGFAPATTAIVPDWPTLRGHILASFDAWNSHQRAARPGDPVEQGGIR